MRLTNFFNKEGIIMLDVYTTMTMEQIIATVDNMVNKGKNGKLYPFHHITYIEGRAPYKDYEATVVVTRSCRFIEHDKTKIYKFEEGVRNAETTEEFEKLEKQYLAFDEEHKARIGKKVMEIFVDKSAKLSAGFGIGITTKKTLSEDTEMEREKPRFYLTACKNGNVLLQVHDSFRKIFKKGAHRVCEYEQPTVRYFLKNKEGVVKEVFGTSETSKAVLDEIRATVNATKKSSKSSGTKTQVRGISISNILEIK